MPFEKESSLYIKLFFVEPTCSELNTVVEKAVWCKCVASGILVWPITFECSERFSITFSFLKEHKP